MKKQETWQFLLITETLLVYKLTEFFIKVGDFDNANELYEEYSKSSQHDVSRFILYYDLRKAQNASDNELVGILEDYRDHEIDEKYMYELAKLYYKTGRKKNVLRHVIISFCGFRMVYTLRKQYS